MVLGIFPGDTPNDLPTSLQVYAAKIQPYLEAEAFATNLRESDLENSNT
jgi:hypothetical protein